MAGELPFELVAYCGVFHFFDYTCTQQQRLYLLSKRIGTRHFTQPITRAIAYSQQRIMCLREITLLGEEALKLPVIMLA